MICLCPVCNGKGFVQGGFYTNTGEQGVTGCGSEQCRRCGGIGTITDDNINDINHALLIERLQNVCGKCGKHKNSNGSMACDMGNNLEGDCVWLINKGECHLLKSSKYQFFGTATYTRDCKPGCIIMERIPAFFQGKIHVTVEKIPE